MALLDGRRLSRPKALVRSFVRSTVRSFVRNSCPVRPWNPAFVRLRRLAIPPCLWMLLLTLSAACNLPVRALGQTTLNDVHIQPREPENTAGKTKTEEVATQSIVSQSLNTHVRPLKVAVDLVLVPVTITDPLNRLVTGLEKENFQLFEGSAPQEIKSFSSEDAPVSLGVIFDSSGSMSSKMDRAKDAVMEFFKTANPQDEFFMITFSDEPEVVNDFTSSVDEIQNKLVFTVPRRRTALLDAIYMGVSKMREAKYPKKVAPHHLRWRRQSQPLH